jgi:NodT family efflux transporter outer membrane factor (OMF) lipoprotein
LPRAPIADNARSNRPWHPLVAVLLSVLLFASGCSSIEQWWHNGAKVGPNYSPPPAPVADAWVESGDRHLTNSPALDCGWWTVFGDPTLNNLVDSAYRENLNLKIAGTRILESRAQRNIAAGNLFPQSQSALMDYAHGQLSKNMGLPLGNSLDIWASGFNASWELDFWGKFRRTVEANDAQVDASVESYRDALVLMLSEVATNYVQVRTYEQRLDYGRRNIEIQRGSLQLAEVRFRKGASTELDMRQARANLAQTESLLPPLEAGRRQASHRLAVLLGMPASDIAHGFPAAAIPRPPLQVSVGVPADLLRRRPDIGTAERQLAAESARIGVAQADFYPRVSVNGFLGYTAKDLNELYEPKSFTALVLPTVSWPLLNYGRIVNGVRAQDARFQRAAFQYQQTVLTASQEVEDALSGFLQAQLQAQRLEAEVVELERAVVLATEQFEGGLADFNRVFDTQAALVNAKDQLAIARGNIDLNLIQAYRALGGGWECFLQPCTPAPAMNPETGLPVIPQEEVPAPAASAPVAPPDHDDQSGVGRPPETRLPGH